MLKFFVAALTAIVAITAPGALAETPTSEYGPSERIEGVFFSNFENATLNVCPTEGGCAAWVYGEAYSLICPEGACAKLRDHMQAASTPSDPTPTQYIHVVLTGQKSLTKTKSRFLGDPMQTIVVESIESVEDMPQP